MREHLYKAKRVNWMELPKEEWWVEGNLLISDDDYYIITYFGVSCVEKLNNYVCDKLIRLHAFEVDKETVYEYTGKTDKKGTKIWENDICKVGEFIFKVVFKNSHWNFEIISKRTYCNPWFDSHCGDYCEVIGNVFDNPELLEGGEAE